MRAVRRDRPRPARGRSGRRARCPGTPAGPSRARATGRGGSRSGSRSCPRSAPRPATRACGARRARGSRAARRRRRRALAPPVPRRGRPRTGPAPRRWGGPESRVTRRSQVAASASGRGEALLGEDGVHEGVDGIAVRRERVTAFGRVDDRREGPVLLPRSAGLDPRGEGPTSCCSRGRSNSGGGIAVRVLVDDATVQIAQLESPGSTTRARPRACRGAGRPCASPRRVRGSGSSGPRGPAAPRWRSRERPRRGGRSGGEEQCHCLRG